jgi:hypothetical protein
LPRQALVELAAELQEQELQADHALHRKHQAKAIWATLEILVALLEIRADKSALPAILADQSELQLIPEDKLQSVEILVDQELITALKAVKIVWTEIAPDAIIAFKTAKKDAMTECKTAWIVKAIVWKVARPKVTPA